MSKFDDTNSINRKVAIIGGGISGLSCAKRLKELGNNDVFVFDTGKRNIGGRCSTRSFNGLIFDHSSQYITIDDNSEFKKEIKQYLDKNVMKEWTGSIKKLNKNNVIEEVHDNINTKRYIGSLGMMSIPNALSDGLNIIRPIWVSKLIKLPNNRWKLKQYNDDLGEFDVVVIAHNGKCAERLINTIPSTLLHERLKVSFGPILPKPESMRKMQLCSLWVGTFAVKKGIIPNFGDAMIIDNELPLSWICCTSRKIGQHHEEYESYTVISDREFAAANKVPQESIPIDKEIEVKNILLRAFESALKLDPQSINPIQFKIQLWGAALCLNFLPSPYVLDSTNRIAICGDWMNSSEYTTGPNIETAYMSGLKLANALIENQLNDVGLSDTDCYQATATNPIGDITLNQSKSIIKGPPLNSFISSSTGNNNNNRNRRSNNRNKINTKI